VTTRALWRLASWVAIRPEVPVAPSTSLLSAAIGGARWQLAGRAGFQPAGRRDGRWP
jgi:hypothetical protein